MVQRRVRQHHAEIMLVRSNAGQPHTRRGENDGAGRRKEQSFRFGRQFDDFTRQLDSGGHHGKRLFAAELPFAQRGDRFWMTRITTEVIAADPLHGHNFACSKKFGGFAEAGCVPNNRACRRFERIVRTAVWASNWLSMEAAVAGVVILLAAEFIHGPLPHGSSRTIVWQTVDHAKARTAIRAIDVRVEEARIRRIE